MGSSGLFGAIVYGDDLAAQKPDPAPLRAGARATRLRRRAGGRGLRRRHARRHADGGRRRHPGGRDRVDPRGRGRAARGRRRRDGRLGRRVDRPPASTRRRRPRRPTPRPAEPTPMHALIVAAGSPPDRAALDRRGPAGRTGSSWSSRPTAAPRPPSALGLRVDLAVGDFDSIDPARARPAASAPASRSRRAGRQGRVGHRAGRPRGARPRRRRADDRRRARRAGSTTSSPNVGLLGPARARRAAGRAARRRGRASARSAARARLRPDAAGPAISCRSCRSDRASTA